MAWLLAQAHAAYTIPPKDYDLTAFNIRPECSFEVTSFDTDMINRTLMATYHTIKTNHDYCYPYKTTTLISEVNGQLSWSKNFGTHFIIESV